MKYTLIRSGRRTLSAEISRGGEIIVRAPYKTPQANIEKFLDANREYIEKAVERAQKRKIMYSADSPEGEILRKKAEDYIPKRVEYYSEIMQLKPQSVRITSAQKRFGSCSNQGRVCFSFNLMQYPLEVVDYVIVHELAHLSELNHSKKFWAIVEKYIPDYKKRRALLKE